MTMTSASASASAPPPANHRPTGKIVFNHLAKCGGTSLLSLLEERFGAGYLRTWPRDWDRVRAALADPTVICLTAHFDSTPPDVAAALHDGSHVLFSVTRDPADRYQSAFYFARDVYPPMDPERLSERFDVVGAARRGIFPHYLRNSQAAQICLRPTMLSPLTTDELAGILDEHYILLGCVERMDAMVEQMRLLGLVAPTASTEHLNRTDSKDKLLDPETREGIRQACWMDTALNRHLQAEGVRFNPRLFARLQRILRRADAG